MSRHRAFLEMAGSLAGIRSRPRGLPVAALMVCRSRDGELSGPAAVGRVVRGRAFGIAVLAALAALAASAQTASEKPSADVRRVGMRLQCQCGCKDSVATCSMLECGFSKPAKERIARMQAVGMTDGQIVQAFIQDYGPGIYLAPPSAFGWVVPYSVAGLGLVAVWLFVRKYYKPRPAAADGAPEPYDPALDKYKDQIEKDLADWE